MGWCELMREHAREIAEELADARKRRDAIECEYGPYIASPYDDDECPECGCHLGTGR